MPQELIIPRNPIIDATHGNGTKQNGKPPIALEVPEALRNLGYIQEDLVRKDGKRLVVWERKPQASSTANSIGETPPTIVAFHGGSGQWNHSKQGFREKWLAEIDQHFPNAHVVAVTMPGYGKFNAGANPQGKPEWEWASQGNPTATEFDDAIKTIYQHLKQGGANFGNVIAMGESLGCYHALRFANHAKDEGTPINTVAMAAPFTSLAEAGADRERRRKQTIPVIGEVGLLGSLFAPAEARAIAGAILAPLDQRFNNIREIQKLSGSGTKILVVSPQADTTVPREHHEAVARAAQIARLHTTLTPDVGTDHIDWKRDLFMQSLQEVYEKCPTPDVEIGKMRATHPLEIS